MEAHGHARALFSFEGRASDELSFNEGDRICLVSPSPTDDQWYCGRIHAYEGVFPMNFVEFLIDDVDCPDQACTRGQRAPSYLSDLTPKTPTRPSRGFSLASEVFCSVVPEHSDHPHDTEMDVPSPPSPSETKSLTPTRSLPFMASPPVPPPPLSDTRRQALLASVSSHQQLLGQIRTPLPDEGSSLSSPPSAVVTGRLPGTDFGGSNVQIAQLGPQFADYLWDSFDLVRQRAEENVSAVRDILSFLKKRVAAEEEYSKALLAISGEGSGRISLSISKLLGEHSAASVLEGTLSTGWMGTVENAKTLAAMHKKFATDVQNHVCTPLAAFLKEHEKQVKRIVTESQRLEKAFRTTEEAMNKADASYRKAAENHFKIVELLLQLEAAKVNDPTKGAQIGKLQTKKQLAKEKLEMADDEYKVALATFNAVQKRFYNDDIPGLLDSMQRIDEEKFAFLKAHLSIYSGYNTPYRAALAEASDAMANGISQIDAVKDIHSFVSRHATHRDKPLPLEYKPAVSQPFKPPPPAVKHNLPCDTPLQDVLNNKQTCDMFHVYLKSELNVELLDFWLFVQDFKKIPSDEIRKNVATQIYTRYIDRDGDQAINIDPYILKTIVERMEGGEKAPTDLFDEAEAHVFETMMLDPLPRFLALG